jgi:hypothetical protein
MPRPLCHKTCNPDTYRTHTTLSRSTCLGVHVMASALAASCVSPSDSCAAIGSLRRSSLKVPAVLGSWRTPETGVYTHTHDTELVSQLHVNLRFVITSTYVSAFTSVQAVSSRSCSSRAWAFLNTHIHDERCARCHLRERGSAPTSTACKLLHTLI